MSGRRKLTDAEKDAIRKAQNGKCAGLPGYECATVLEPGNHHFDHDKPRWLTGSDDPKEFKARCIPCHHIKTHHPKGPHLGQGGDNWEAKKTDRMRAKHAGEMVRTGRPFPRRADPWGKSSWGSYRGGR
jgi:hypothetical protein